MFVSTQPVPVCVDPDGTPESEKNVIWIKPKMDFGTKQRVQNAMLQVTPKQAADVDNVPMDLAAYQIQLLVGNVVRWAGPAFTDVPCDAAHILQLDPDEPLVGAVLEEIATRNKAKAAPVPNAVGANGSTSAGDLPSPDA